MANSPVPTQDDLIACEICLTEIPGTVSGNAEADEYVVHYCGLECYELWRAQQEAANDKTS